MKTGDEASVAKTINARSGQVYNRDDKLAKELDMFLLRSAYFLLTIKVPSPDFEISAKEYVFFLHYYYYVDWVICLDPQGYVKGRKAR